MVAFECSNKAFKTEPNHDFVRKLQETNAALEDRVRHLETEDVNLREFTRKLQETNAALEDRVRHLQTEDADLLDLVRKL